MYISYTTIKIKNTQDKLSKLGSISENYYSVISNLLDHVDHCDQFWENRT